MIRKIIFIIFCLLAPAIHAQKADFDTQFRQAGLIDVTTLDPTIQVRLVYATADNFVHKSMYGSLRKAYLVPEIAKMVVAAQAKLREKYPDYSLIIFDAARPMSVQRTMFHLVAGTPLNIYVANPAKGGGRHNYGTAVDISIIDKNGNLLEMGSAFDHFGKESHAGNEAQMVRDGIITAQAMKNRALLTSVLTAQGFTQHPKEWWHFHKYSMEELKKRYKLLDF